MASNILAGVLGEFLSNVSAASISPEALDSARVRILDALGCAIAGATNVTTKLAQKWAHTRVTGGPSTFWFSGERGLTADCALANSIFTASILHEDASAAGHPGSHVIPSTFAVAEAEHSSGLDVLGAVALAYEIQTRIAARGAAQKNVPAGAMRPAAMLGIFGTAVAAARLMKLSPLQAKNTLAFCASFAAPGIGEPLVVGSFERCLQTGQLTQSGVLAAELARVGFDGADGALDGECGYYSSFLGADAPIDKITGGLGTKWLSAETDPSYIFKPYPTAVLNVPATYCAEQLAKNNKIAHNEVKKVLIRQSYWDRNTGYIYNGPFKTIEQALMSAPFAVATALISGRYDWPAVEAALGNAEVDALAKKTVVEGGVGGTRRRYETASIDVTFTNGRELHMAIDTMPPEMIHLNWDLAVKKFANVTRQNMSERLQESMISQVRDIHLMSDIGGIIADLTAQSLGAAKR